MKKYISAILVNVAVMALSASAAIIQTNSLDTTYWNMFPVSSTDLINGNAGTGTGDFGTMLTDGDVTSHYDDAVLTCTYNLDTMVNTNGYNITEINTFTTAGDSRIKQSFTVQYSVVGDASFQTLGTYEYLTAATQPSSLKIAITNSLGGAIMNNVDQLRFQLNLIPYPENGNLGSAYQELDVFGAAAPIPEPGALALLATGFVGLLWRKRNSAALG